MHYVVHMTTAWETGIIPEFDLSDRLRKAREMTGMNIEDFAAHIDKSRNTVSNYESADYSKKRQDSTLKLWAMATGVPFSWIKDGKAPGSNGPSDGDSAQPDQDGVTCLYPWREAAIAGCAA